ncbi:MAG: hypothetical protein Q4C70_03540 [Planctomycetia bacterium]|nr:hypothetical protein [Planctomycetia bacterium]
MAIEVPFQVEFDIPHGVELTPAESANIMKLVGVRYASFMKRRFDTFSQGGGDWKPLAKSTLRARDRKVKKSKKKKTQAEAVVANHSILVDTGTLRGALNIGATGTGDGAELVTNVNPQESSVTMRFTGKIHPPPKDGKKKKDCKGLTIAALAAIQHYGSQERNIPARPILVEPNAEQMGKLEDLIRRQVKKAYETR